MKRLALAALAAAWILSSGPVRAQGPKESLFDIIRSFRPAQESNMGAGSGDYLREAVEEIIRQQSLAQTPAEIEPEAPDVAVLSEQALRRIISGYNNRMLAPIMRNVHPDYRVDAGLLREALVRDFRANTLLALRADIDKIDVTGDEALVLFRYRLALTNNTGAQTQFTGRTRVRFKMNGPRAQLIQQDAPMIFGASAPASEIPRAESQGPSATAGSTGPTCPTPLTGAVTMNDGTHGFFFRTQSVITPPPLTGADFFKAGGTLRSFNGSGMKSLGFGPLRDVKYLPNGGFAGAVGISVGQRIGIRTAEKRAAIIRIESFGIDGGGLAIMTFSYMFQPGEGVRCFP